MHWWRLLCAAAAVLPAAAEAQTIRPVIVEYLDDARGRFELENPTLYPLQVVLEGRSFSVDDEGQQVFRPLDGSIRLRLSQMSLTIPPRQTRTVFYEVTADSLPAWLSIYATFGGYPRQDGMNVQVELPHTVYLTGRGRPTETEVEVRLVRHDPSASEVEVEVRNVGPSLGRALAIEVRGASSGAEHGGFPLFPGGVRRLRVPWDDPEPPRQVLVRLDGAVLRRDLAP